MMMVVVATTLGLLLSGSRLGAQEGGGFKPDDLWLRAYNLLQEGIKFEEQGKWLDALAKYNESKPLFDGLAREFPGFHPDLVEYRRTMLVRKLGALKDQLRNANRPASGNYAATNAPRPDPGPGTPNVQPTSPEFAPSAPPTSGSVQLPQWPSQANPTAPAVNPAAPTAVVRPPDPSVINNSAAAPYPPAPSNWESRQTTAPLATAAPNPFERIQRDFDRMRLEVERLSQRNQVLETDLARKQSQFYDSQTQLAESQRRAADLQRRLQLVESEARNNPDFQKEVERLKAILTESLGELEKSNLEKKELLAQLNSTQNELERIRRERDDIEKERNNLAAMMEGGGESAVVAQLTEDNRQLREKLKEVEKSARALRKDNGDKTIKIALLKEQVEQIKSEREKLLADNRRYEGYVLELRNRLKTLGQELTEEDLAKVAAPSPHAGAEKELLLSVVLKQLRRQSQVMETKRLLLRELDKVGADAESLFAMVEDMANGPDLSEEERKMFKTPEMVELVEAAGVERVEGVILVEGAESDGSGTGIVETQNLDDELIQLQKAARLDYSEGRYKEAEASYRKYLKFRPKSVVCLCNLALVKMATRDYDEAEGLLEKAIAIKNDYGLAYYLLGRNFFAQSRFDEALERLNVSILHDPKNARAHNCVGVISSRKGFVHRAEGSFNKAVEIDPKFGDAHFNLAVLYATMEQPDSVKAEEHYERAINLGVPRDVSIEHYLEAVRLSATAVSLR